jgi:hypothetical protein
MKIRRPGRSLYLLSITGLAELDGQYHSLSGTYFSAIKHVTVCFQPSQADRRTASLVYVNIRSLDTIFFWSFLHASFKKVILFRVKSEVKYLPNFRGAQFPWTARVPSTPQFIFSLNPWRERTIAGKYIVGTVLLDSIINHPNPRKN